MENLFVNVFNRSKAQAAAFGGSFITGADAFKEVADNPGRTNTMASMFSDGDVVTIPKVPSDDPKTAEQWLYKPLSRNGDPVLSVLVKVKNSKTGVESVKELFLGTFAKSVRDIEHNEWKQNEGTACQAIAGLATVGEQWQQLAGKTVVFSKPVPVKILRRDFTGKRPDQPGTTTLFTIDFK